MARILVALLMLMLGANNAFAGSKSSALQIKGSDTMVNLGQAWAEKYMEEHPDAFIAVTGGGSGTGMASLISGTCNIAMSSRNIKQKEVDQDKARGHTPVEVKVALDGIAVVVSPKNPVAKLTVDQLAGIVSGKITNWKQLGGPDAKIVVLSREVNSGTHVYFKEHVLRKNDPKSKEEFAPGALMLSSSQAIADEVSGNPAAIGYYGMGYISPKQKAVAVARDEQSEYIEPTIDNVVKNLYPISRPLYFYVNDECQGLTKKFIDFALSPEGQAIVKETDFVPIK
ncbi:MAG: phosphate ABC transporter substrate-binding protein [Candidatus Omnitrophica bacterium]|nr:phosphate ABC transporter substrate-binding protein [Candidatus Omnitrophota bacterium]